ncbi:MAG: hypothetical protein NDF56_08110 [archaeon GB-1845-036]|nr:hypothetical protein [Candidatus Culexmicrobium thermophilum]
MCGIFAYIGEQPLKLTTVISILKELEEDQLSVDKSPVGGHGAGIAVVQDGEIYLSKVGRKGSESPAENLLKNISGSWRFNEAKIIVGHVRRASKQFQQTIPYSECTQPYLTRCTGRYSIISVHNGFLKNYMELLRDFQLKHIFESEKVVLIDSEIFPHLMEELLLKYEDKERIENILFDKIEGNNTVLLLVCKKLCKEVYILHKGATRGLYVWKNNGNLLLCSRRHIVERYLRELASKLERVVEIKPRVADNLVFHLKL